MAQVNEPAPELEVDQWVQGDPVTIKESLGKVILIEVFQVNCPGCFMGGFPEILEIFNKYRESPLVICGLSTAFEDFDKNNLENLKKLLTTGEVAGETLSALDRANLLHSGRLPYKIPFPVAMDRLVKQSGEVNKEDINKIIQRDIGHFETLPQPTQEMILRQITDYLKKKEYQARTFEKYELRGTPSTIIVDKRGILRHKLFGSGHGLEEHILSLLNE